MIGRIAKRYARAIFEIAEEENTIREVSDGLHLLAKVLDPDARRSLASPFVPEEARAGVLEEVLAKVDVSDTVQNSLRVLLGAGRIELLDEVVAGFDELEDDKLGRARAQVRFAHSPSEQDKEDVRKFLGQITGRKILLDEQVDPDLLAGMVAEIGSQVYDASLANQLNRLQRQLKGREV